MFQFNTFRIEEAVNGFMVSEISLGNDYREVCETKLEALRIVESRINARIIEELERLQGTYDKPESIEFREASNG
jgi:hypothetical protein